MTKYCYHLDVVLKLSATTFILGIIKVELLENIAFRWSIETMVHSKKFKVNRKCGGIQTSSY